MEEALKAEAAFKEKLAKLKKMPDDMELNREIAILYLARKQIEKALPISKKMPDDLKLTGHFALFYIEQQQLEKALPIAEKVFEKDVKNETGLIPKLHTELGLTYGRQIRDGAGEINTENLQKAVKHFEVIIEKYPKDSLYEAAQYYLGTTYVFGNQFDKGIAILEKFVNHATDKELKVHAEAMLKRAKELAEAAEDAN